MEQMRFSWVKVKNENGRQVLYWTAPMFGSLKLQHEGGRLVIKKQTLFSTKTYIPSLNESVETRR
jgi:hypothetical protein